MNEAAWEYGTDPVEMLDHTGGRGWDRKSRLLGCAFCRRTWDLLTHRESRLAVETAERYVDGIAGRSELESAWESAWSTFETIDTDIGSRTLAIMASWVASQTCHSHAFVVPQAVTEATRIACLRRDSRARVERDALPELIRDIFPNPFRPSIINPSIARARDGLVLRTAQGIYSERRFDDMPLLAKLLEEAGCNDAHVLDHCRGRSRHARGCWVLDKLLGFPDQALTEEEWDAGEVALELLSFVRSTASARGLRLLACACGRHAWSEMAAECSKRAIEVSENFATGVSTEQDMQRMMGEIDDWDESHPARLEWSAAYDDSIWVSDELASHEIARAALHPSAWQAATIALVNLRSRDDQSLHRRACTSLRDIFQYPFQKVTRDPSWLANGVIEALRSLRADRSFENMILLADELEKAGCSNKAVLNHCRSREPHTFGCWVLDLLSGTQ